MAKKKIKPLGDNLLELEVILDEMIDSHELQHGDIISLVWNYLEVHRKDAQEQFEDGAKPILRYGHPEDIDE